MVEILHKLGNCLSYNLTCEIETAQANVALISQNDNSILQLLPHDSCVLTYFSVDNFDKLVESMQGGGGVHPIHLVAFQEESTSAMNNLESITFTRDKVRKITPLRKEATSIAINVKKEPPKIINSEETVIYDNQSFQHKYLIWLIFRLLNNSDQTVPILNG